MRAVVQRVNRAAVTVAGESVGRIERGLLVFVGVMVGDASADAQLLARKVAALRVFEDAEEKMNLSVKDVGGSLLAVSQFTLLGDARKGNRPSFVQAMDPESARVLFDEFCAAAREQELPVQTGRFRAQMEVSLENDGPVTLLLDTKRLF